MGSMREARAAGIQLAVRATASRRRPAAVRDMGSLGLRP